MKKKTHPTDISRTPAFPIPDAFVLFQNWMIARVTLARCLATGAQVSADSSPYLIYTAAKLQDGRGARGPQLCQSGRSRAVSNRNGPNPQLAGIKNPYKKDDALSVINTAHSCVESAVERLTVYKFFWVFSLLFFPSLEVPISSHWFLREARGG